MTDARMLDHTISKSAYGSLGQVKCSKVCRPCMFLLSNKKLDDYDLSTLHCCMEGGQTMPVPNMEEVEVQFVDDFPKTSSGKILRRRLHELDEDS